MAPKSRVLIFSIFFVFSILSSINLVKAEVKAEEESKSEEAVIALDSSNFEETISKNSFIVVEFYAPWCGACKSLAPEWEKAALLLLTHDPPVALAKVDATEETNKELASKYGVQGFPTIKIFRNEGKNIQHYKGPREADGIVEYLKKQSGPASFEIKSAEDAKDVLPENKVTIVGVFPEFVGKEFENFKVVAEKLRSDYDFSHVKDAKLLPIGDLEVKGPIVRLLKPFDELFVDTQDFDVEALENFVVVASTPLVTTYNKDPVNHPYVVKFFNNENAKAMFFLSFALKNFEALKSKFYEVASSFKGKDMSFLVGDLNENESSQGILEYFGIKESQAPLLVIQENDGAKYLKSNVEPDQIADWFKEYTEGSLKTYRKSDPIPEVNNEPVKVVVADNINDVVNSEKNVLIEFYAPWCGHCKKLAPILDEVAVTFEKDPDVVIAKMDATTNDIPSEYDVKGYPTLYFSSASGKLSHYDGDRTADAIISFINSNKESSAQSAAPVQTESEPAKDEL